MFDYTGLFIGDGSVTIDTLDNETLESLIEEVGMMYEILMSEKENRANCKGENI